MICDCVKRLLAINVVLQSHSIVLKTFFGVIYFTWWNTLYPKKTNEGNEMWDEDSFKTCGVCVVELVSLYMLSVYWLLLIWYTNRGVARNLFLRGQKKLKDNSKCKNKTL